MFRNVLIAALIALAAISGPAGSALAQQRVTSGTLQELKNKLDAQRDAYYRLDMAEREAMEEGSPERAATFREAKNKAYEAYVTVNAQLQKAQMDKRAQDAQNAQANPDYR